MHRRKSLILSFIIVVLLSILIIRERSRSPFFEVTITRENEPAIVLPGYLVPCRLTEKLYCQLSLDRQLLVIEETDSLDCRVTFGKQRPICRWIQASALESISIEGLELTPYQLGQIKYPMKPFPTVRIFDDVAINSQFLGCILGILSIWTGCNVAESIFFYLRGFYPYRNRLFQAILQVFSFLVGLGVVYLLSLYSLYLLLKFGYMG
ncbi:hypothetical protein [Calothrix sp. 336/3]|uniref:hypothetical protein n=1 Tax=Calothrix sp. 336/3 TaxID=1337936 RepID=UPI0004E39C1B|nr:hypothetical protein [Calothrix sp. 336/3]AKG20001.1 hypothetical protein IJ00_00570 [Calothrix sp. 336/3]